jgi:hypothetical protein
MSCLKKIKITVKLLASRKIESLDSDMFWTSFWYKYAGWCVITNRRQLGGSDTADGRPANWRILDYGLFYLTGSFGIRIFSCLSLIALILYTRNLWFAIAFLSPVFFYYFINEVKPEIPFLLLFFFSILIQPDSWILSIIFSIASVYNVTVAAVAIVYSLAQTFEASRFEVMLLFSLMVAGLISIYPMAKTRVELKKNLGGLGNNKLFLRRPSKAALLSIAVLTYFSMTGGALFLAPIVLIATNQMLVRFLDSSTERRLYFLSVILHSHFNDISSLLFLFFPFNLISSVPQCSLINAIANKRQLRKIKNLLSLPHVRKETRPLIFWYQGDYDMANRIRYLWYPVEFESREQRYVVPDIFLFLKQVNDNWLKAYQNMEKLHDRELASFLSAYGLIIAPEAKVSQLTRLGFKQVGVLTTRHMEKLYTNDVRLVLLRKLT